MIVNNDKIFGQCSTFVGNCLSNDLILIFDSENYQSYYKLNNRPLQKFYNSLQKSIQQPQYNTLYQLPIYILQHSYLIAKGINLTELNYKQKIQNIKYQNITRLARPNCNTLHVFGMPSLVSDKICLMDLVTKVPFLNSILQQIMNVLLLILFFQITNCTLYNFTDTSIHISAVSSGNVGNSSSTDTCNKLIIRDYQVYHLSSQAIYRGWLKNSLASPTSNLNLFSLLSTVQDFDVSSEESQLVFYIYSLLGLANTKSIYAISLQYSVYSVSSSSQSAVPVQIFINKNYTYDFYGSSSSIFQPAIQKRNLSSNNVVDSVTSSSSYLKMAVSPNYLIGVTWTSQTSCLFYNLTSLIQIGSYSPVSTPNAGTTNSITFSKDSQYAIIETDNYNPIVIINLTNFTVAYSITVVDTIKQAYFLDNASTILVVHASTAVVFVNLTSNKQYSTPYINATLFGADQQNNVFTCYKNVITQSTITFTPIITQSNNNTTPTNTSSNNATSNDTSSNNGTITPNQSQANSNTNYTSNQTSELDSNSPYSRPIHLDKLQQQMMDRINPTLQTTTSIATNLANFAASIPLSIYFLTFLNFITISTLYVLLNFRIPQHIYEYLTAMNHDINVSILNMLGINYTLPQFTDQKITSPRALQFGLTSDIIVGNFSNLVISVFSVFLTCVLCLMAKKFMSKGSMIRQWLVDEKQNMIYGQIIGLMQSFILPWSFVLSFGDCNLHTRIHTAIYLLFFLLFTLFPFYYFLVLIQQSKSGEVQPMLKANRTQTYRLEWVKQSKFKLTDKIKTKNKSLFRLINAQMLYNWYLCFTNVIFPLLVLLQNPVIFLVAIFMYDLAGIAIAWRLTKFRINTFVLSVYPFLLHCCFIIFKWCSSNNVISITEIVCFLVLLAGIIHNMLTTVVQLFLSVRQLLIKCCRRNRVNQLHQASNTKAKIIQQYNTINIKSNTTNAAAKNLRNTISDPFSKKQKRLVQVFPSIPASTQSSKNQLKVGNCIRPAKTMGGKSRIAVKSSKPTNRLKCLVILA